VETDCTALEEDLDCGFISSQCVKYAQGESRLCLGSYCKSKVLTACIERRKASCCFNSQLARILNEQIRPCRSGAAGASPTTRTAPGSR